MGIYLEIRQEDKEYPLSSYKNKGEDLLYPHWHKEVEIVYVIKGSLRLGVNDVPIQMKEGEVQIINAGDVHYYLASPDSERLVLLVDLNLFQEISSDNKEEPSLRDIFVNIESSSRGWTIDIADRMREIIESVYYEDTNRRDGYTYAVKAKVFQMLTLIYRDIPKNKVIQSKSKISEEVLSKSQETLKRLDKIFAYVENHYKEPITLQEVADYMGFNAFYFTRFFKKNMGMTFITFLNDYRLNKAKWILLNQEIPVTEVAENSGFSSVKTFHHLFKDAMGISPLKYRKSIYGNNRTKK